MSRVSADVAYFRRTQGHYTSTDNRDIGPSDYDQYCVTAPRDSRLPDGGGYQICGLYDLKLEKFGPQFADDNFVTFAEKFGPRQVTFDGVDVIVNARPRSNLLLNGGFATGIDKDNDCAQIVDSPQKRFCDSSSGWLTQYKMSGSYTIPWQDIQVGAVLQNLPGQEIRASWSVVSTDAQGLGRAFSGGGSRTVQLIEPGTQYSARRTQLDLRFAKTFRLMTRRRLQVMGDIYNTFNSNAPVGANSQAGETPPGLNTNYSTANQATNPGGAWLTPLNILQGRYLKFGASFTF